MIATTIIVAGTIPSPMHTLARGILVLVAGAMVCASASSVGTARSANAANSADVADAAKSVRWIKKHLMVNPYESATVGDLNRDGSHLRCRS
jgi:hypothetical protein